MSLVPANSQQPLPVGVLGPVAVDLSLENLSLGGPDDEGTKDAGAKCTPDKDITLSICGFNELRVTDHCTNETRQKYVTVEGGPPETYWDYEELRNLACLLHDAPEFKTPQFASHANLVINLGWTLVHSKTRAELVAALLLLMRAWFRDCQKDHFCIPPPSRVVLGDRQALKYLAAIDALKDSLVQAKLVNAREQVSSGNAAILSPEQVALIGDDDMAALLRKA